MAGLSLGRIVDVTGAAPDLSLCGFAPPPVKRDDQNEGDEDEGKCHAKDADRALHGASNLLWVSAIPHLERGAVRFNIKGKC